MANRPPGNRCYFCDRPLGNISRVSKGLNAHDFAVFKPKHGLREILGYCHAYDCTDDQDDNNDIKVRKRG